MKMRRVIMTQTSVVLQARAPREIYGAVRCLVTGTVTILEISLCENQKPWYLHSGAGRGASGQESPTAEKGGAKDFLAQGGQRNRLKSLNSDKEIQGNPSFFL
jgi:hypothetical protein